MHDVFEKAKLQHAAGWLEGAESSYREALERDPDSVKLRNNLGVVLQDQGRLKEAFTCYRQALTIDPDAPKVHYNLGHALHTFGRLEEAIAAYSRALEVEPESVAAHYNLGNALYQRGRLEEAEASYRCALTHDPGLGRAHTRLGDVLFDQGRVEEALACYRRALEIDPESESAHLSLGRVLDELGRADEAAAAYQRVLELNRACGAAYEHLARLRSQAGLHDEAAATIEQWLIATPGDPIARHMMAACTGRDVMPRASDAFIRAFFDARADDFDVTMSRIDYSGPQLVDMVLADECERTAAQRDILDAGCGTGLCGPILRRFARRLVGVDLSDAMLGKASRRGVYDELVSAELTAFLGDFIEAFDVIVAADTLICFGDLAPVFEAMAGALRFDGRLIFTVEALAEAVGSGGSRLRPHGRYVHTEDYVAAALAEAGLTVHLVASATLRREAAQPVAGLVVLAGKDTTPSRANS